MSKKPDPKKSKKAEASLDDQESRELGMILDRLSVQDPEGTSLENYLKSLERTLEGRDTLIAALLEQLGRKPSKVGFQAFMVLKERVRDRKVARVIKQAGYRFSQRGFAPEREEAPTVDKVVLVPKEGRRPTAHVLPIDGTFLLFAALIPEPAYPSPTLVTALMERDLERPYIRVIEGSQKTYRDYLQKVGERHPDRRPCEVPMYHAARLFRELLDFCRSREVTPERGQAWRLLSPFHEPQRQPFAYELMPSLENPRQHLEALDEVALLQTVDWSWIIFPKEELGPYRQKMQDLDNPVLVIPPEVQEERAIDLIKKAADDLCAGKTRLLYQRFFEEQALWLKMTSKDDLAMAAWIVAQHLQSSTGAGESPVVRQMVSLSLKHHWPEDFEEHKRQTEPFQRTESGLIVPS
jgi:hypothetical protein